MKCIVLLLLSMLCLNSCIKPPVAVANYRAQLIGTYTGLQTGSRQTHDTGIHYYVDSLTTFSIQSSIEDIDALVINSSKVYKDRETFNYYLFSDSSTNVGTSQGMTNESTIINEVEFFLDVDSISITHRSSGGQTGAPTGTISVDSKYRFEGYKD